MTEGVKTIMYPVTDLEKTKTLFGELLGLEPYMDEAYYVGFNVEGQDIGLDPHGHSKGMTGPVAYWHVDDIEERLRALLDAGAEAQQGIRDVGGGKLLASVKDGDGNVIGLVQSPCKSQPVWQGSVSTTARARFGRADQSQ
jgi:predicted enzyme related to lactoylglutathione lyase